MQAQSPIPELLAQNSVLLLQIPDHLLLALIHPTGNRHQQELKRIEHSRHLLPILSTLPSVTNRLSIQSFTISGPYEERVNSSRNRLNPRGVKRKMSAYPLRPRKPQRTRRIDYSKQISIVK